MSDAPLVAEPAFSKLDAMHDGWAVAERSGLGLASVFVRKGRQADLAARVSSLYGVDLPLTPKRIAAQDVAFVGTTSGGWLAVAESGGFAFARALAEELDGLASVSDQSSGYAVLRLSGPRARYGLQKTVALDLHPKVFLRGSAAATSIAHIGVTLWSVDDEAFDVAMFRSMAGSLATFLSHAG